MRILLVDALGSFTQDLAEHWRSQGHDVLQRKEFDYYDVIGRDFVFVEWADKNAWMASYRRLPVPLVVRLNTYEQFTDFPAKINWKNVDKILHNSQHVADFVDASFLPSCPTTVIPSAIDINKWKFKKRQNVTRPNVSVVGELDAKKGIQLLLQVMSQWTSAFFHVRGRFYDGRYVMLVNDYIEKAKLTDRVRFYFERVPDMDAWLEDKDYHLSCSPYEGHPYNVTEAMAKGIKPLIFSFSGAETLFPRDCLWVTLKDLRDVINGNYNSESYRQWVIGKGWTLEAQFKQFDEVLKNPSKIEVDDVAKYWDNYVPVSLGDLKGENKRLNALSAFIKRYIKPTDRVIDMGCGIGVTTNEISKITKDVWGADVSIKSISAAMTAFPQITFTAEDITAISPRALDGINTACLFCCLEYILPEKRVEFYRSLERFDKLLINLAVGHVQSGKRLHILDDEISVEEITVELPGHKISANQTYDLAEWGQYRFLLLEKVKKETPKERELVAA